MIITRCHVVNTRQHSNSYYVSLHVPWIDHWLFLWNVLTKYNIMGYAYMCISIYGCFVLKYFGKLFTTAYFDMLLIIATCLQILNDQLHLKLFVIIFQIFLYFPSHTISVNRFPSHYSSRLCLHQLSFIYGFVGRKNHKNTKYMHIFILLFLFSIKQLHLILGQIFIWGYEKEMWEWIIDNCLEMLPKIIFFSILSAMMNASLIYILFYNNYCVHVFCFIRCASSRNFKINTLITCIVIIHMKICYTGSLYTDTNIIFIEVAYFKLPFMTLGLNFINSVSLGFTIKIIIIVCNLL